MRLKVVVPPHPLIAHWLTVLRNRSTPPILYATAFEQIGLWLTYEALRDWIPRKEEEVITPQGKAIGTVIEANIPILTIPLTAGGFEIWQGSKKAIPNGNLCLDGVPTRIEENAGIIIYIDQISSGENLLKILNELNNLGVNANRIRVITSLAASSGLLLIGEKMPQLTIYASCIDPEILNKDEIIPGIGNPSVRLNTRMKGSN